MDTDSCESDAAEELKGRKYDENYIDLGFTYIGSGVFLIHSVLYVQKYYLTTRWNLHSCADI